MFRQQSNSSFGVASNGPAEFNDKRKIVPPKPTPRMVNGVHESKAAGKQVNYISYITTSYSRMYELVCLAILLQLLFHAT